jgi:chromosome segregation ATPase
MDFHDRVSKKSQDPEFSFTALPTDDPTSTNPTPTESVCDSCEVHQRAANAARSQCEELQSLNSNLSERVQRLAEDLTKLTEDKNAIEAANVDIRAAAERASVAASNVRELREQNDQLRAQLQSKESELTASFYQVEALTKAKDELTAAINSTATMRDAEEELRMRKLRSEVETLQSQLATMSRLSEDLTEVNQCLTTATEETEKLRGQISTLSSNLDKAEEAKRHLENEIQALLSQIRELELAQANDNQQAEIRRNEMAELQNKYDKVLEERDETLMDNHRLDVKLQKYKGYTADRDNTIANLTEQIESLQEQLSEQQVRHGQELEKIHDQFQLEISEQLAVHARELAEQNTLQHGTRGPPQQRQTYVAPPAPFNQARELHELAGTPIIPWPDGDDLVLRKLSLVKKSEVMAGMEVIEEIEAILEKQMARKKQKVFSKRKVVEHYQFFGKGDIEEMVDCCKAFEGWELCIGPGMLKLTPADRSRETIIQAWRSQRMLCLVRPAHLEPLRRSKSFQNFRNLDRWKKAHNGDVIQRIIEIDTEDEDESYQESEDDSRDAPQPGSSDSTALIVSNNRKRRLESREPEPLLKSDQRGPVNLLMNDPARKIIDVKRRKYFLQ